MAPQNFNPWSLTFDHVLFEVSQVAITTNNFDRRWYSERQRIKNLTWNAKSEKWPRAAKIPLFLFRRVITTMSVLGLSLPFQPRFNDNHHEKVPARRYFWFKF
jgi:hypothetical protein